MLLQSKLLNVITLGQTKSDNKNRLFSYSKCDLQMWSQQSADNINHWLHLAAFTVKNILDLQIF